MLLQRESSCVSWTLREIPWYHYSLTSRSTRAHVGPLKMGLGQASESPATPGRCWPPPWPPLRAAGSLAVEMFLTRDSEALLSCFNNDLLRKLCKLIVIVGGEDLKRQLLEIKVRQKPLRTWSKFQESMAAHTVWWFDLFLALSSRHHTRFFKGK